MVERFELLAARPEAKAIPEQLWCGLRFIFMRRTWALPKVSHRGLPTGGNQ